MTGAGAATVAFAKETAFMGSLEDADADGNPEYYLPGRNVSVQNLSLQNVLRRMRTPHNVEAVDSLAGNLEGAFAVTYAMSADTHPDVRDIVFNDAGGGFVVGPAPSSRWFLGAEYLSGGATATVERELKGTIPLEYQVQYQQETNTIQETLTMGYADEENRTTITPSSIIEPTDGNDVPFHGTTLTVDAATVAKLQSATLTFSGISRFQRGPSRTPVDAVSGQPVTTLEAATIFSGEDYLDLAYGASGATTPQDQLTNVSGSLAFDVAGATVATFDLPQLKPDTYDWEDLVAGDADLTEPVTYHVNGGVTVS